jgi:acetoin utilization deacetylase AcuC-like enzyme
MRVTERGFAAMCSAVRQLAEQSCRGRLVLVLEGGYDLDALAGSTRACLEVLTGRRDDFPAGGDRARSAMAATRAALASTWPVLA